MPTSFLFVGNGNGAARCHSILQHLCHCTPGETDADIAGILVLVVSTDPRLLAHAEAHAARDGTHRFQAKPLDLDALLTYI
jgi:hypothetical protein